MILVLLYCNKKGNGLFGRLGILAMSYLTQRTNKAIQKGFECTLTLCIYINKLIECITLLFTYVNLYIERLQRIKMHAYKKAIQCYLIQITVIYLRLPYSVYVCKNSKSDTKYHTRIRKTSICSIRSFDIMSFVTGKPHICMVCAKRTRD